MKNKLNIKNNNGITLIALVVTIIVLIILAGVSINLVFGQQGIITRAKGAAEATKVASVKEQMQLKLLDLQTEKMLTGGSVTTDELANIINNAGGTPIYDNEGNITGVKVENTEIPIKEVTSGITIGDNGDDIPKAGESGYAGGSYNDPYIPVGFSHVGTEDWNSGYTIKDSLNNEFVWVPCVTDRAKVKEGDTVETFKKTTTGKYNSGSLGLAPTDTTVTDADPTDAIKTSVGIYGGFYIAKYEAGVPLTENGTEIAPTSATTSQKARSVAGATVWTDISRTNAITAAANMIDSSSAEVYSGLISGECWDTTLQWMVNSSTNAATNVGYDTNSAGNGYYGQSAKTTTGQYPINNIYDMAGNVWEWTTENCTDYGISYLVNRGGSYNHSGSGSPAAYRGSFNDFADSSISFRVVLYK